MKTIPPLAKGDTIAIVATARKVVLQDIQTSIHTFASWGLIVVLSPNLFSENNQFAGTDEQRLSDIQWALDNPKIKAIICARGGYGTTRIIDQIDYSKFIINPKWVIGFSDITALLFHLNNLKVESIHGIMPILFPNTQAQHSIQNLRNLLFGNPISYSVLPHIMNKLGKCEGEVIGGNLSIINNLVGTNSDSDLTNKILFFEDLDEYLYHLDRMMGHLARAGKLQSLAGLIVGHFTDMKDNVIPFGSNAYQIIHQHTQKYNYPIVYGFPIGHAFDNLPIICGRMGALEISEKGTIFEQKNRSN